MSAEPERRSLTRYHARWVQPVSSPLIEDGTVVVDHDRIAYVGPRSSAPPARDVELGDAMLTPGLVNAHTHLDLTVLRGRLGALPFFDWIRQLVAARAALSPHELLESARLGIHEGLRAGITTYADTAPNDAPLEAMRELGVRGIAYREVFGPDPAHCDQAMDELRHHLAAAHEGQRRAGPLVRVGVSPHAPYSVSDALYRAASAYAREEGLPLATHVAESADESDLVTNGEGSFAAFLRGRGIAVAQRARTPVALLAGCGVLTPGTVLVHCVRVDAADIAEIVRHRCGVATCPMSNRHFAHGSAPVQELLAAGVPLGVGSDSMASNDVMDVLREARLALGVRSDQALASESLAAWELATLGGARALGMDAEIGSLEPGKQADFAVFPVSVPERGTAARVSVRVGPASAALVVVAGRIVFDALRWRPLSPLH